LRLTEYRSYLSSTIQALEEGTARRHCKKALQEGTARRHCKKVLQEGTARRHCKETLFKHYYAIFVGLRVRGDQCRNRRYLFFFRVGN
jgi:hypothetical protein